MGADAVIPPPPPGFEVDPPPPPGFEIDPPRPAAPAPTRGLAPRTGAAAVPTAEEAATGVYTPPPAAAPARERTTKDRVIGAVEAGIELLSQFTGGMAGQVVGGIEGIGESVASGTFGTQAGVQQAQQRAAQRGQQGTELARRGLQMNPITGPLVAQVQAGGGGLGEGMSPAGQEYTEDVGGALQQLPPVAGVYGTMQGPGMMAAGGVRPMVAKGLEGPTQAIRQVAERVIDRVAPAETPAPGTKGSAGAAAVDMATQRRERAADLPQPIKLTKGQATRTFEQQRFEKETAKDPEAGKPLRERMADQTEAVTKNFEAFVEATGAAETDPKAVGPRVVDPLVEKAQAAKKKIREAYDAADAAGETAEPVDYSAVRAYLDEQSPTAKEKLAPILKMAEEQLAKNDPTDSGMVSIKALEDVRKSIRANAEYGTPNYVQAQELIRRIDQATENAGGDLYKGARKLYREYAAEFKNKGVIRDLIALKKGTTDRRVAFEDVFDRAVLRGSLDDLKNVRETLVSAGPKGEQAWKDMRGTAVEHIKREVFSNDARDERGNKIPSSAKFGRVIDKLEADGKLEFLFGKQGAQQLRDLREITADIYTAPPGAVNTSNTASVVLAAIDAMIAGTTGIPAPALTALKYTRDKLKQRKVNKGVREALAGDDPLPPQPDKAQAFAKDGAPPTPEPAAPRETPPPAPPRGGSSSGGSQQPGLFDKPAAGATKRERELVRLREQTTDPDVIKDLDAEIAAERKRETARKKGEEYLRLADATEDPELRRRLEKKAGDLGAKREKIPQPQVKELTTAEANQLAGDRTPDPQPEPLTGLDVTELEPDVVDAVTAFTQNAEALAEWQRTHRFGDLDAKASQNVARALQYDPAAVERAGQQLERSPRAFEREIQRIIDEGEARARQAQQADRGSEGSARAPEEAGANDGAAARVPAGQGEPRADGNAAPAADRAAADAAGRQAGRVKASPQRQAKIDEAAKLAADGVPAPLVDEAVQLLRQYDAAPPVDVPPTVRTRLEGLLQPLIERAERANGAFSDKVRSLAKQLGAEAKTAPVKSAKRSVEKLYADELETGMPATPESIRDLVRATIVVPTEADVPKAVRAIRDNFDVIKVKDRFESPMPTGYRDVLLNVRLPDGSIGEVQVHIPEMLAAKELGHLLYEIERVLPDGMERTRFVQAQSRFYGGAYEAAGRRAGSGQSASSLSNTSRLTGMSSSGDRSTTPVTADRNPMEGERKTGSPSRSKNEASAGMGNAGFIGDSPNSAIVARAPSGARTSVTTERGVEVPVQYKLVDVGNLITSHDDSLRIDPRFPGELQPRDRTRQASELQITKIENDIKPQLLADSYKASDGAPIIGADGVVESGNARTIALRRAYGSGKAEGYREWLAANAERFGLTPDDVRKMKRPMLVRQGLGDYDRAEFARQANESAVSAMSETEQARADAARLPDLEGLEVNDAGEMLQGGSAGFIRDFLRVAVSPNERNAMVTADGRLSQRGAARIRNAIFAKAYGDADLTAMLTEATDGNVKNILAGMLRASPTVARVRDLLQAGARNGADFVPELIDAVRRYSKAREDGMKVDQALAQVGMFGDEASPRVAAMMRELEDNARAPKRVAEMIQRLADEIDNAGDPRQNILLEQRARYGKLADDLDAQQQFLAQRASAAGFKSLDEWVAKDFDGFMRAADEWRQRNPAAELREPSPAPQAADARAARKVQAEHDKLAAQGFRFERSDDTGINTVVHHYGHTDGSRAVVMENRDPINGRTSVMSYINTTNQGRVREPEPPLLSAQTPEDLKAKAQREAAAAAADKAEQQRLAEKAKADAMRDEFTLTGSDRPADNPNQGSLFERDAAPYTTDLFGNPVEPPKPARAKRGGLDVPKQQRAAGLVEPPEGEYATRAAMVTTREQQLGHTGPVRTLADAAHALAYLNKSAVERLDALVTDSTGKPLRVIGGFKGALSQTSVYPTTLLAEAMQIPGAARLWLVHNHPSGKTMLSRADSFMAQQVANVFDGTGISVEGILAVGRDSWGGGNRKSQFEQFGYASAGDTSGKLEPKPGPTIPAQERQIVKDGKLGPAIESPQDAKRIVRELVNRNMGRPTIVLLDAQHQPVATIPWNADEAMPLKNNGRLDALLRAVSEANAGAAFIGTGNVAPNVMTLAEAQNLGAALAKADVRVLDIIDGSGSSAAEKGLDTTAKVLRNVGAGAAAIGLGLAGAPRPQTEEQE